LISGQNSPNLIRILAEFERAPHGRRRSAVDAVSYFNTAVFVGAVVNHMHERAITACEMVIAFWNRSPLAFGNLVVRLTLWHGAAPSVKSSFVNKTAYRHSDGIPLVRPDYVKVVQCFRAFLIVRVFGRILAKS
jgi:hypothetical protein